MKKDIAGLLTLRREIPDEHSEVSSPMYSAQSGSVASVLRRDIKG